MPFSKGFPEFLGIQLGKMAEISFKTTPHKNGISVRRCRFIKKMLKSVHAGFLPVLVVIDTLLYRASTQKR